MITTRIRISDRKKKESWIAIVCRFVQTWLMRQKHHKLIGIGSNNTKPMNLIQKIISPRNSKTNNMKTLFLNWFFRIHKSSISIFFKSSHFIMSQRNELYGPTDFLANFGGLLGLFTGFSVLSLLEIIYFLSVRLICNTRLYGYWAGPDTTYSS